MHILQQSQGCTKATYHIAPFTCPLRTAAQSGRFRARLAVMRPRGTQQEMGPLDLVRSSPTKFANKIMQFTLGPFEIYNTYINQKFLIQLHKESNFFFIVNFLCHDAWGPILAGGLRH